MPVTLASRPGFRPRAAGSPGEVAEPNDATPFLPERSSLKALREAAANCRGCHLWRGTTQTVFGEGRKRSRLMLVGEQPGDREDLAGKPFVGPASRELNRALEAAASSAARPTSRTSSSTSSSRNAVAVASTRRPSASRWRPAAPGSMRS